MVADAHVAYLLALQESDRPRTYLAGASPDDQAEHWYFEAVEDGDHLVAIRQLTIEVDGSRHAYSPQHIEDVWGALTDQPIDYAHELESISEDRFREVWASR